MYIYIYIYIHIYIYIYIYNTTTHCNTLTRTATHWNILRGAISALAIRPHNTATHYKTQHTS